MQEKRWFSSLLDIFGLLSLTCAVITLGGAIWFADVISASLLFNAFYACLATGVASFLLSRLAEILSVVYNTPDPRSQRKRAVTETDVATSPALVADRETVTEGEFPLAA
jgi:hypothetical protein